MNKSNEKTYFHRVAEESPTKLWINNATVEKAKAALEAGAVGSSTNPTYPSKLPADDLNTLIDAELSRYKDNDALAEAVYVAAVQRIQAIFWPLYEQSKGKHGYVAIQGDPRVNTDVDAIMEGALKYRKIANNIAVKVPASPAGAAAMEELTAMGHPTIATLGFSVDQAIYMAEAYRRGLQGTQERPFCMITFIAGILEDCLKEQSESQGNIVKKEVIEEGSIHGHRVAYKIFQERKYEAYLIGGGARGARHFLEVVGGDNYVTIGWNLAEELIQRNGPVERRMEAKVPSEVIAELDAKLPDYTKSYTEGSLRPEEFCEYGPAAFFQNSFLVGWDKLLGAIRERKAN